MADAPAHADVVAQDSKLVGDEAQEQAFEVQPEVNSTSVAAQVAPEREASPAEQPVHETYVQLDEVITDPSDPRAVQVPDAGRGFLNLPIHSLADGSPEQVFAAQAAEPESDESDDDASSDDES